MRLHLIPHPDNCCAALTGIDCIIRRSFEGTIRACFVARGQMAEFLWPRPAVPQRADGLWRHSCFELFVKSEGESGYIECNLSPSQNWSGYGFTGYRCGMKDIAIPPPRITTSQDHDHFLLRAQLRPSLAADRDWCCQASAVIEEINGRISYWAVQHAPGAADFHQQDCFTVRLWANRKP